MLARGGWEREERRRLRAGAGTAATVRGGYDARATGRLCIVVHGVRGRGRQRMWSDRTNWTLEDRLAELLLELECRAAEQREWLREQERETSDRARQSHRASERLVEDERAPLLRAQVSAYQEASAIRAYCKALEDAAGHGVASGSSAAQWIAWARAFADRIDPLTAPPTMPPEPETGLEDRG